MCGIVGIVSNKSVSASIVDALKKLEYRGYDSAGISTISKGQINEQKCSGRVDNLEKILFQKPYFVQNIRQLSISALLALVIPLEEYPSREEGAPK